MTFHFTAWLAQEVDPSLVLQQQMRLRDMRVVQVSIFVGILILVIGSLVLWALHYSKKGRRKRHRTRHRSEELRRAAAAEIEPDESEDATRSRRRRRRAGHPRRKMNPTLADQGGLPPVRDDNAPRNFP